MTRHGRFLESTSGVHGSPATSAAPDLSSRA
jgi:hypothetical protein